MKFEFSEENRMIPLHTFDEEGAYIGIIETLVPANQGIPARAISGDLITENTPVWNSKFRRVEYSDDAGAKWFINSSNEKISVDTNAVKEEKPVDKSGYKTQWTDGKYEQVEDHVGKICYSKSNMKTLEIEELGTIPSGYTLKEPPSQYHAFEGDEWVYKIEKEIPIKSSNLITWRNNIMVKVVNGIDKHRIDQSAPDGLKSKKPIDEARLLELYELRIALQDLPDKENFPFCEIPLVPAWLN